LGPKDAWIDEKEEVPIRATVKFPSKLMVWAGIAWNGKTDLIRIPQGLRMNADDYIEHVASHIPEEAKSIFGNRKKWKLLEDGAPVHKARVTRTWYANHGVDAISNFPPNSPDLNLAENMWKVFDDVVATRRPTTIDGLWRVLKQEWDGMSIETVNKLVLSMTDRLNAVITAQGGNTKY
jgi:hypothetical protein